MKFVKILIPVAVLLLLASCGGGGGGDDDGNGGEGGGNPTPDATPTPMPGATPEPTPEPTPVVIEDQNLRLTSATAGVNEGTARVTRFATVDLNAQRLRSRTTVNIAAGGETLSAVATAYAQFTARSDEGALFADMNWEGTILSSINLSASSEMLVHLRVRELNPNGSLGPEIFARQLERDGIGSGLKSVEKRDVSGNISQAYQLSLKEGQVYRVVVELECKLQVDGISLALIDCNAESDSRGLFVNELIVMY